MRPLKLYSKILFSFLTLLFLVESLVVGSFMYFMERNARAHGDRNFSTLTYFSEKFIRDSLPPGPADQARLAQALTPAVKQLTETIFAPVWIKDGGLEVLPPSGEAFPAQAAQEALREGHRQGRLAVLGHQKEGLYLVLPFKAPPLADPLLVVRLPPPPHIEIEYIVLGAILLICLLMVPLTIPVSRLLVRPVKELRRSALIIASGDLSHRAHLGTRDEIGELALAFNLMTDRLEKMILASRELLAYVSHELRSPLARLGVSAQLLRDSLERQGSDGATRHLDGIEEEIGQMDGLLAKILMLSRLDLRQAPQAWEPVDLAELLQQLASRWQPLLGYRGLELKLELPPTAQVLGDGEALASAFGNLLDNAAKHALAPGRVSLGLARAGASWEINLRNQAEPLAAEELEAIFRPFHRSTSAQAPGSGLGLPLARKIIEAHGGALRALRQGQELVILATLPVMGRGEAARAGR